MRSPICWFGGKGLMIAKLLPLMPVCKRYIEPFGGGASVLLARTPVELEVYNDIDLSLHLFFATLADEQLFSEFYRRVQVLPYSRRLYDECGAWCRKNQPDYGEYVWRWFVVARQSFSGSWGSSWSSVVTTSIRGMAQTASNWITCLEGLPEVHRRLQRVQIENADWSTVLERYDTPNSLFYCDPPYVHGSRRAGKYEHEMTDDQHRALLDQLRRIKGKVVLSGYPNELYDDVLDWHYVDFQTACHAAGRTRHTGIQGNGSALDKQPRTERVWIKGGSAQQGRLEF